MAKSIRQISDIPNFDTYPAAPPDSQAGRTGAERSSIERPSLEQRAAELGAAAGKITFIVRQTKERVEKLTHRPIRDRVSGLGESTRARAEHLRRLAAARAQEWTHAAQDKTADVVRQAKSGYFRARDRASQTVREYPVQTALAAGAVGFLVGVWLRIRRTRRAY